MWLFGKMQVGRNSFYKVQGEVKDCQLVEETNDLYGIEALSHV
jgi:hypothetical protein